MHTAYSKFLEPGFTAEYVTDQNAHTIITGDYVEVKRIPGLEQGIYYAARTVDSPYCFIFPGVPKEIRMELGLFLKAYLFDPHCSLHRLPRDVIDYIFHIDFPRLRVKLTDISRLYRESSFSQPKYETDPDHTPPQGKFSLLLFFISDLYLSSLAANWVGDMFRKYFDYAMDDQKATQLPVSTSYISAILFPHFSLLKVLMPKIYASLVPGQVNNENFVPIDTSPPDSSLQLKGTEIQGSESLESLSNSHLRHESTFLACMQPPHLVLAGECVDSRDTVTDLESPVLLTPRDAKIALSKTLKDSLNARLKEFVLLKALSLGISRVSDLLHLFEKCIVKSHLKPRTEIWFVKYPDTSIGGTIRGYISTMVSKGFLTNIRRGEYVLSDSGVQRLLCFKERESVDDYQYYIEMLKSFKKEEDKLVDAFRKLNLSTQDPVHKYYQCGVLNDNIRNRLRSFKYIACIRDSKTVKDKQVLWIGILTGQTTFQTPPEWASEDIEIEVIERLENCNFAVSRFESGRSWGTMGFVGCSEKIRYGVTNAHVILTKEEESAKFREQGLVLHSSDSDPEDMDGDLFSGIIIENPPVRHGVTTYIDSETLKSDRIKIKCKSLLAADSIGKPVYASPFSEPAFARVKHAVYDDSGSDYALLQFSDKANYPLSSRNMYTWANTKIFLEKTQQSEEIKQIEPKQEKELELEQERKSFSPILMEIFAKLNNGIVGKVGARTGYTSGKLRIGSVNLDPPEDKFANCYLVESVSSETPFIMSGDSGSLVFGKFKGFLFPIGIVRSWAKTQDGGIINLIVSIEVIIEGITQLLRKEFDICNYSCESCRKPEVTPDEDSTDSEDCVKKPDIEINNNLYETSRETGTNTIPCESTTTCSTNHSSLWHT